MNKILLRLLRLFDGFWRRININPDHLHTILEVKLKMDGRRKTAFNYQRSAQKKEVKGQDILVMVMMAFMGLGGAFIFVFFEHSSSGLFIYLSFWMAILALTLISDFTDVLIDVRDNYILLPRPVEGKTLAVSRILHVFFYLTKLVIPFSIPGLIAVGIKFGPLVVLLLAFLILMSVLMTIFFVNLLYLVMLNLLSPRKFKEIINYFQIVFYSVVFLGYQILPRMIDFQVVGGNNFFNKIYLWPLPSMWLASIWDLLFYQPAQPMIYVLALLGLITPFVAIYLVGTVLSRNFSQKMFSIGEGGSSRESSPQLRAEQHQQARFSWAQSSAQWFCANKHERAMYELTWKLTSRSRDFKLKFYPNLIMLPVYFLLIFVFPATRNSDNALEEMQQGSMYLFGFYFSMIILISGLSMLQFSEKYKSSWFYRTVPIPQPGLVLTGSFKAIIVKFYLPVYSLITLGSGLFFGWHTLDDALLAFFGILASVTGVAILTHYVLPFTKSWDEASRGGNMGFTFLTMILAGFFGFFHYLIAGFSWVIWGLIPICVLLTVLAMRQYSKTGWRFISWE
ncbi:MAG: hypothetical protein SFV55_23020 [Haliscomenobacter sp.]|uniref:hypothetical protein n=1 Tax=Haliscomenobacter sp. TaxID=2717303 RepID=UPI0029A4FB28|nr:hypothetical protein [Haliscomenobacter sp.]MDX2071318.1 hypothetical protein [Haliscomenobacter sp.]